MWKVLSINGVLRLQSCYTVIQRSTLKYKKCIFVPFMKSNFEDISCVTNGFTNNHVRSFKSSSAYFCETNGQNAKSEDENKESIDPSKDRTKIIPPEVGIRYMESQAYKETYGDDPVWKKYRRNFKGQFPPPKTRKKCFRKGVISTGNPCPICRDEYLVLHYTNVKLLKQFISPYTGEVYNANKTNVCQKKQFELEVAVEKAKDYGLLTFDVPFMKYNYADFLDVKEGQ